jgi:small subunit ribosomal protein S5
VTIEVLPGPRGLGLVAGENIRTLLKLAGLKDAWTKSYGSTNTMASTTKAIFNALRSTFAAG